MFISFPGSAGTYNAEYHTPSSFYSSIYGCFRDVCSPPSFLLSCSSSTRKRNRGTPYKRSTDLCGPYCPRDTGKWLETETGQGEGGGGARERGEGETGKGRQRDFPNAFQPTELNVIMHGEDFIIGR